MPRCRGRRTPTHARGVRPLESTNSIELRAGLVANSWVPSFWRDKNQNLITPPNDHHDCPAPGDKHLPPVHKLDGGTAIELGVDHPHS